MHQPIRDHLEAYLRDSEDRKIPQEFHAHLAACSSCKQDFRGIAGHSQLFRAIQIQAQARPEPTGSFYAGVLNRIAEGKTDSFWSVFLEPMLGKRLGYACAALVLVLGTYLVTTEPGEHGQASEPATMSMDVAAQPRDAVLVNLASFRE